MIRLVSYGFAPGTGIKVSIGNGISYIARFSTRRVEAIGAITNDGKIAYRDHSFYGLQTKMYSGLYE